MTVLKRVYMLSVETVLDFDTLAEVFRTGHSRIPVYEGARDNVVGLMFTKDLILLSPEVCVCVCVVCVCCVRVLCVYVLCMCRVCVVCV